MSGGPSDTPAGQTDSRLLALVMQELWQEAEHYDAARRWVEEIAAGHHAATGQDLEYLKVAAASQLEFDFQMFRARRAEVADHLLTMLRCAMEEKFFELFGLVMEFATKAEWRDQIKRFFAASGPGSYRYDQLHILEKRVQALEQLKASGQEQPKPDWSAEQIQTALQKITDLSLRVRKLEKSSQ